MLQATTQTTVYRILLWHRPFVRMLWRYNTDDSICDGGRLICQNQGRCLNDTSCICYPGYTGPDCSFG